MNFFTLNNNFPLNLNIKDKNSGGRLVIGMKKAKSIESYDYGNIHVAWKDGACN